MAHFFNRIGPFIAVGRPGLFFRRSGPAFERLSDDAWQAQVIQWMSIAQVVVLQLSDTRWTWWELCTYVERHGTARLLLFTGAISLDSVRYRRIQEKARVELGLRLPENPGYGSFTFFDEDGDGKSLWLHPWPIILWPFLPSRLNLGRTLRPFLSRLDDLSRHADLKPPQPARVEGS